MLPSLKHDWYPTRLLDIGEQGTTNWKLHVVAEDGIPIPSRYLTLSYRWGHNPASVLLSSNIANFRSENSIGDLPTLFQDFILVAWHFSIRYVWIDALCIIQDSEQDWDTEAGRMHAVYSHAICNIAACHSASPSDGLFNAMNSETVPPVMIESSLFSTEPHLCYMFDADYWEHHISGPLITRGWVFQERFLAPRVLYFAKTQLLWECRTQHRCEVFPAGIPLHRSHKVESTLLGILPTEDALNAKSFSNDLFKMWCNLIESYSKCDLTYLSDKLLAIAGIAKLFQKNTNDKYFAGLWGSMILDMIDWRVNAPESRQSSEYRAPSWSWASIDGPINLPVYSRHHEFLVELLDIKVVTRFGAEMSTVLSGFIKFKGRVLTAVIQAVNLPFATFSVASSELKVLIAPDTLDVEFAEQCCITYMPFKLEYVYSIKHLDGIKTELKRPYVVCLMLEQVDSALDSELQYRRIGRFEIEGQDKIDSFCLKAEMQTFKII